MRKSRDRGTPVPKGRVPLGRPPEGEETPESVFVGFWARPDVVEALKRLEDDIGGELRARRSAAIRRAILKNAAILGAPTK